ncbi:hypothetical protein H4582DRAFT_1124262 [Lactarius indigo]|nr:hypothetical protein H4582DRAFT_1124262 [Lactarius indigo]
MTAGMSLLGAYQGGMSTSVHDYLPQGHRPVIVVNPRSVRLFRSMTRAWLLRLPGSVDMTDRIRRVWTLALSLGTSCARLSFKFCSRAPMHIYRLIDENDIPSHDVHLSSFFPIPCLPTGLWASSYRQYCLHVKQFRTRHSQSALLMAGFWGALTRQGTIKVEQRT